MRSLDPRTWFRRRREQALICSLLCVLEHAGRRWVERPGEDITVDEQDYALLRARVLAEHAAKGLKYVGPFCAWRQLLTFAERGASTQELAYRLPSPDCRVVSVGISALPDARLVVRFAESGGDAGTWDIEDARETWRRVVCVPRHRGRWKKEHAS